MVRAVAGNADLPLCSSVASLTSASPQVYFSLPAIASESFSFNRAHILSRISAISLPSTSRPLLGSSQ